MLEKAGGACGEGSVPLGAGPAPGPAFAAAGLAALGLLARLRALSALRCAVLPGGARRRLPWLPDEEGGMQREQGRPGQRPDTLTTGARPLRRGLGGALGHKRQEQPEPWRGSQEAYGGGRSSHRRVRRPSPLCRWRRRPHRRRCPPRLAAPPTPPCCSPNAALLLQHPQIHDTPSSAAGHLRWAARGVDRRHLDRCSDPQQHRA
jgi:hypothetical protein